jgi:hypothetical protein
MRRSIYAAVMTVAAVAGAALVEGGVIEAAMASAPRTAKSGVPPGKADDAKANAAKSNAGQVAPQIVYLVRSTLSALQDANSTGNYSVLRDLAAPSFQAKHSAADLAEIFAQARRKPIDLAAAAVMPPVILDMARPDPERLNITGHVGADPSKVAFALHFEAVNGHWRIAALSVSQASIQPVATQPH